MEQATLHIIYNGTYKATIGKTILLALAGSTYDPTLYMAPAKLSGADMRVQRIKLAGTKKRPVVWIECELVNSRDKANISGIITIADYDAATRLGEIYNPKHITREIAISRLREAKELFEMGIYSEAEFNKEKAKFAPFIRPTP